MCVGGGGVLVFGLAHCCKQCFSQAEAKSILKQISF